MSIELVARDWNHLDWCGSFYPDGLPEDWRLTYFANAFEATLIPLSVWRSQAEVLGQWANDVPTRFRFYLETDANGDTAGVAPAAAALGERFAGSVRAPQTCTPQDPSPKNDQLLPAWDAQGAPILARSFPGHLTCDPRGALQWLRNLSVEAQSQPALAIVSDTTADNLIRLGQLVTLAGLA